jgi:hypothetical protein
MIGSNHSELEGMWMRVAKKIEHLISAASHDRRISNARFSANADLGPLILQQQTWANAGGHGALAASDIQKSVGHS